MVSICFLRLVDQPVGSFVAESIVSNWGYLANQLTAQLFSSSYIPVVCMKTFPKRAERAFWCHPHYFNRHAVRGLWVIFNMYYYINSWPKGFGTKRRHPFCQPAQWSNNSIINTDIESALPASNRTGCMLAGTMARNASHVAAKWPTSRSNEFWQKIQKKMAQANTGLPSLEEPLLPSWRTIL